MEFITLDTIAERTGTTGPNDAWWPAQLPFTDEVWSVPEGQVSLREGEVHVWRVFLDHWERKGKVLWSCLEECEKQRAGRFRFETDRKAFVIAHGALRFVLAGYLRADPNRLRFSTNRYGKPCLADSPNRKTVFFNMSHSNRLVVCAVSTSNEVGVDIECCEDGAFDESLAEQTLTSREYDFLMGCPQDVRKVLFLSTWTRKEALIKAMGVGFSVEPAHIEVPMLAIPPNGLPWESDSELILRDFFPGERYLGALASKGPILDARFFELSETPGT